MNTRDVLHRLGSMVPLEFLVVSYEMLDGSGDAFGLQPIDISGSNSSVEVGIFGERLEASSTERGPLSVHGGPQEDVATLISVVSIH